MTFEHPKPLRLFPRIKLGDKVEMVLQHSR